LSMPNHHQDNRSTSQSCPFDTLGFAQVPKDLDIDTLREAYKAASLRHHPDKAPPGISDAERAARTKRMQEVNHAFEVLQARVSGPSDHLSGVHGMPDRHLTGAYQGGSEDALTRPTKANIAFERPALPRL